MGDNFEFFKSAKEKKTALKCFGAIFKDEAKITIGTANEYKAAISLSVTDGRTFSMNKSKTVELRKDTFWVKVDNDKKEDITGKWMSTVTQDRILTVKGATQFDLKKQVDIKSGEGLRLEAKNDVSLKSSQKNVAVASDSKTVLIKAGKNIDLQSCGSKMKIHASGINYKGKLHQIG